jgi:hypothetical protein
MRISHPRKSEKENCAVQPERSGEPPPGDNHMPTVYFQSVEGSVTYRTTGRLRRAVEEGLLRRELNSVKLAGHDPDDDRP